MKSKLVIDLDDTISFCFDRDFANAKPNNGVINKVNELYQLGWEIEIRTARGSLSVGGTAIDRARKYDSQIREWLGRHGVLYHTLSFEKPLATLYVDDKAMRPDEFAQLTTQDFSKGLSGAKVSRVGEWVFKTQNSPEEALLVVDWYKRTSTILDTPKVHSVVGSTIQLEYVEHSGIPTEEQFWSVIQKIRTVGDVSKTNWGSYILRCEEHIKQIQNSELRLTSLKMLNKTSWDEIAEKYQSWCHGDFTVDNVLLSTSGHPILIDPIPMGNCWSSWLLDVSKLAQSYSRNGYLERRNHLYYQLNLHPEEIEFVKFLEWTHWLRMLKYTQDPELKHKTEEHIYAGYNQYSEEYR